MIVENNLNWNEPVNEFLIYFVITYFCNLRL